MKAEDDEIIQHEVSKRQHRTKVQCMLIFQLLLQLLNSRGGLTISVMQRFNHLSHTRSNHLSHTRSNHLSHTRFNNTQSNEL